MARSRFVRAVIALALLAPLVGAVTWELNRSSAPKAPGVKALDGHDVRYGKSRTQVDGSSAKPLREPWPSAASAVVDVDTRGKSGAPRRSTARKTPVWVQPGGSSYAGPKKIAVRMTSRETARAAGVNGLVFTAEARDFADRLAQPAAGGAGPLRIGVDYTALAAAYGRNWAASLRLVRMPECALTDPTKTECHTRQPLPAAGIDIKGRTVFAQPAEFAKPGAKLVLAVASGDPGGGSDGSPGGGDGGAAGTYNATTLKPSGSWSAGGSRGSFTYTYPILTPPAASGLVPKVALAYDSSRVDGQTAATQAQANWAGDGWGLPDSFIEQSFTSCNDKPEGEAAPKKSGEFCYAGEILTLSLNGQTTPLVWDVAKKTYTPANADGQRVEKVKRPQHVDGLYDEYWKVTDRSGTSYYFGLEKLPGNGWTSNSSTHSVDTEPVYSAHKPDGKKFTDPCWNSKGFDDSWCNAAFRWHLDYVTDVTGNAMAYYYDQDKAWYTRNPDPADSSKWKANTEYVRDSHLTRIDYGFRDGEAYTVNNGHAPNQVLFGTGPRCVSGDCGTPTKDKRGGWSDLPNWLFCEKDKACSTTGPAHFSTVRLSGITTRQWTGSAYQPVDAWTLTHTMPDPGDGTDATLWLSKITHTGKDTTAGGPEVTMPDVTFGWQQLQNRVDPKPDGRGPMVRMRLGTVTTETGSVISVNYGQAAACGDVSKIDPATNKTSCYPVYWTPPYSTKPSRDWFTTYQVNSVVQTSSAGTDPTRTTPTMYTGYNYIGGAAYHFDENELVKPKYRTYGQYRGFGTVQTVTGQGMDRQTLQETKYYRGMADAVLVGGHWVEDTGGWERDDPDVPITFSGLGELEDSQHGRHEDLNEFAGEVLENTSHNWVGGPVTGSTINSYWLSGAAASRERANLPPLTSKAVGKVETWTRQQVSGTGTPSWRITQTDTSFDDDTGSATFGLPLVVYSRGDVAEDDQKTCTKTTYAPANTQKNLSGLVAEVQIAAKACGGATSQASSAPDQVNNLSYPGSVNPATELVSDTTTIYDDATLGAKLPTDPHAGTPGPLDRVPTLGLPSEVRIANYDKAAGKLKWQVQQATGYDNVGRPVDTWDAAGHRKHVDVTVSAAGLVTGTTSTNTLGHKSSITLDPLRALPVKTVDANGIATEMTYDGLGRSLAVWGFNRTQDRQPNAKFSYAVSNSQPTAVTTQTLNDSGGYVTATAVYDAMLRPIQAQTSTPQGGRLVTNTFYDSHGWNWKSNNPWWDSNSFPNTTLAMVNDDQVPNQTVTDFDGFGRSVLTTSYYQRQVREQTATAYYGDRTVTVPPKGTPATQTITDGAGRTIESDQFTTRPTVDIDRGTTSAPWTTVSISGGSTKAANGKVQGVGYRYDRLGKRTDVTNLASRDVWHSDYDTLGRVIGKTDPDAGDSTMAYDSLGQLVQTSDAKGTGSFTYDALGRKTGSFRGATPDLTKQIASWSYDNRNPDGSTTVQGLTNMVGRLTTATSYGPGGNQGLDADGKPKGNAYSTQIVGGYNIFGKPLGSKMWIPAGEGDLGGRDYTFGATYTSTTGLLSTEKRPASPGGGALPAETVRHGYTGAFDLPTTLSGLTPYAGPTNYTAYTQVSRAQLGGTTSSTYLTNTYDPHTASLTDAQLTNTAATSTPIDQTTYRYDPAGNPLSQTTVRKGQQAETQCFGYDTLDRLVQAWTENSTKGADSGGCTDPSSNNGESVGSGVPNGAYWTSWNVDPLGQRTGQTEHGVAGAPDKTTTYTYGTKNADGTISQPHTLTKTSVNGTDDSAFTYDQVGNTRTRDLHGKPKQTLGWSDTGELTCVDTGSDCTTPSKDASGYVYDANGNLLVQHNPGSTILYLPGEQLVLDTATHAITGTRYYSLPGGGTAVRTSATNVVFQTGDQQGTATLTIDATFTTPTWRQQSPYGAPRGAAPAAWPDNHGFLGKPTDTSTGLTSVGARWYDPANGRFVSLDPVFQATDDQQQNGYTYAASNPVTHSDPSGLCPRSPECEGVTNPGQDHSQPQTACNDSDCGQPYQAPHITAPPKEHHCGMFDVGCHARDFAKHHPTITNVVVSAVAIGACELATGGAGSAGCVIAGSAAGNMITHALRTPPSQLTLSGTLKAGVEGAGYGVLGLGLGKAGGIIFGRAIANPMVRSIVAKVAEGPAGKATRSVAAKASAVAAKVGPKGEGRAAQAAKQAIGESNCFPAGTKIATAHGQVPIEKIKIGDKVWSRDPATGKNVLKKVTRLFKHTADRLVVLNVAGHQLKVTPTHRIWIVGRGWVSAQALHKGDHLLQINGRTAAITAVGTITSNIPVYNFEVQDTHNYYALAGATPVLVHNDCGGLALGVREHLRKFAQSNGLTHHLDPPRDAAGNIIDDPDYWRVPVMEAIADPKIPLHVNMEGFTNGSFADMVTRGLRAQGPSATDEEMSWIARAVANGRRPWSSIKFHNGPDMTLEPDWSAFGRIMDFPFR